MHGADAGGGRRKIGFNTNHYMRSHIRGRGAGAKSAQQQMGPTPNFPRPLRNRALQSIFVLKATFTLDRQTSLSTRWETGGFIVYGDGWPEPKSVRAK